MLMNRVRTTQAMQVSKRLCLPLLLALSFSMGGCATTSTLNQPLHKNKPLVMSGARLDLAALRDDVVITERFGVAPPDYPLLDLPFSTALDLIVLGYTVPVALVRGR